MNRGGFPLRKWTVNAPELLADLAADQRERVDQSIGKDDTLKVLGLSWTPNDDSFCFVLCSELITPPTKRSILSFILKLYDPLGWAAPVVITAKILLQELWLLKGDWDDPLPPELTDRWHAYYTDLPNLGTIRIPRWTGQHKENLGVEIHGFADASNRAYAAVIYLRVLHSFESVQISLLAAKTKVTPLKTVNIPRLKLNAAVLLCRLLKWTISFLNLSQAPIHR
ncbi:hypothetical protein DMN91_005524 [Ooceraea biroi]|uniref:Uncharacterized protein n=1 Tax=Ooceraea biroi TaxID=2015173 RepID=A0A3L8DL98_OOCBI|nr:hypothetical protein DMN91_005524 [Ooceraea biroi]